jgi:probable HAF family extracellular repeat protein
MYRRTAKPAFKFFASALLDVLLLAAPGSAQPVSPSFPGRPDFSLDRATFDSRERAAVNRQRTNIKDLLSSEEMSPQRERAASERARIKRQQKVDPDRPGINTIPHWSGSYQAEGLTFKYTMVGTDPQKGSKTTVIPTVLIPIKFVFEAGNFWDAPWSQTPVYTDREIVLDANTDLIDGRTPVEGIRNSPIFKPYDFKVGGVSVGGTQYGDAFQRANFWEVVSRQSPEYHVLLSEPTVAPFEVFVPAGFAQLGMDEGGNLYAHFTRGQSFEFLDNAIREAITSHATPQELPIVVVGNVSGPDIFAFGNISDWHGTFEVPGGLQTYILTAYFPSYSMRSDTETLSAKIIAWLNDPFNQNYTPGWNLPGQIYEDCWSYGSLDLMDVSEATRWFLSTNVEVTTEFGTFHLRDGAFLDYFRRVTPSTAANGQYLFFAAADNPYLESAFRSPSPPCTGHVEVDLQPLEAPDSSWTAAYGINDHGWVVGEFGDLSGGRHAFLYDGKSFHRIDHPDGARALIPYDINNAGDIVGAYYPPTGPPRGFLYRNGSFTTLQFPGAADTIARSINERGEIVGMYDLSQPVTRGYILRQGQYSSIDTPFGLQTDVTGINDVGDMVGLAWDDPAGPFNRFTFDRDGYHLSPPVVQEWWSEEFPIHRLTYPRTINKSGMTGGWVWQGAPFSNTGNAGYVTVNGFPYIVFGNGVYGMNDRGQIVGHMEDPDDPSTIVGYVATLPR